MEDRPNAPIDDEWFLERNAFASVGDVPDLPISTFDELTEAVDSGKLALRVSYMDAQLLAPWLGEPAVTFYAWSVRLGPILTTACALVLSFWLRNPAYLWGIAAAAAAILTGSPVVHRSCSVLAPIWCAAAVWCIFLIVRHNYALAFGVGAYVLGVWIVQAYYISCADAIREAALQREPVFLFLLERESIILE